MNAALGLAIVIAHLVAFVLCVPNCRRPELALEVPASLVGGDGGALPPELRASRIETAGTTPGLRYVRYAVDYRGGFTRTVGVASLVGPFQDPANPACSGRVVVGQRLLDDGAAGPGTIAREIENTIRAELATESFVGVGAFQRVEHTSLRWAELVKHLDDLAMIVAAPHGYVRVMTTLVFDRLSVPLVVALVPEPSSARQLAFRVAARAELRFDNRVLQWASDKLGGDKLATRFARRQIDGALITALAPPPPFDLPGGRKLTFGYCDGPPEIADGVSGALPFSVAIDTAAILPPRRGRAVRAPFSPNGTLAIDLDLDAVNAVLFELWRTGFLDRELADAGLDRRFNEDPIVTEYLSLRISAPTLALPPVIGVSRDKLQLFADARVSIRDGASETRGRVWGGLEFALAGDAVTPISVDLGALELSCERSPTTLVPCYADLVAALRDRGGEFHGALTRTFAKLLGDVFVDQRVGASGLPADLVIRGVVPSVKIDGDNGSLHLELDATLRPKR